jgi:hypothetical protein
MRIFRRSLALACLILAPALCAAAQASPLLRLGHRGRWITDALGRVVIVTAKRLVARNLAAKPAVFSAFSARFGRRDSFGHGSG